jgi:hypothetical protein
VYVNLSVTDVHGEVLTLPLDTLSYIGRPSSQPQPRIMLPLHAFTVCLQPCQDPAIHSYVHHVGR